MQDLESGLFELDLEDEDINIYDIRDAFMEFLAYIMSDYKKYYIHLKNKNRNN